ncbi:hypothetical protein [Flavobacterium sp.]|uniref:hypothetical protein n=1 Tax=Flavobacterium sp. TaxID=239 RepID=UPI003D6C1E26
MEENENLNIEEKEFLIFFIEKTGMFMSQIDKNNIVSFLTGYEIDKQNKNIITQKISEIVSRKYNIEYRNTGWLGQISRLSTELGLDWVATFKQIIQEVLKE